jgi:hypothetical protein
MILLSVMPACLGAAANGRYRHAAQLQLEPEPAAARDRPATLLELGNQLLMRGHGGC